MAAREKPIVLIVGAAGRIGGLLAKSLKPRFTVLGFDRVKAPGTADSFTLDLTDEASLRTALGQLRKAHGARLASVIHLAAYFDMTGEENPLYRSLNVEGTERLLGALQEFEVQQFLYASTMLVHAPAALGERLDEASPLAPAFAYPQSKLEAEAAIRKRHGKIPYVILRLAGLYDDASLQPTLAHQMARIYERSSQSHLYPGDLRAGQSVIHGDDLADLVLRLVERRETLPTTLELLAGEPDVMSYEALQLRLAELLHGEETWPTFRIPAPLAKAGAWLQHRSEPLVPDDLDQGVEPFIRPFMVGMADDHYAINIARARQLTGWEPQHRLDSVLPEIVARLKQDPLAWYRRNGLTAPDWLQVADATVKDAERLRRRHEESLREQHRASRWAHATNFALGTWLATAPPLLGYGSSAMAISDLASGLAVMLLALLSFSWRLTWARWAVAGVGLWVLFAPLALWAPEATAYLNGTLVGTLLVGFAVGIRPPVGVSPVAAETGPTVPPGWDFSPSSWAQRLPILLLALVGLHISRYLAAYQLGYIEDVWDPFFDGGGDAARNGTEEIITSSVSQAWPVPDAGLGALTYALEILSGLIGSSRRWRTMPWLVLLFGILIVPLGIVSVTFIIIQPIVIGTWCTLCLVAAAAMLVQIPYSLDELVATGQFLLRRKRAGRPLLRVLLSGDGDSGRRQREADEFDRPAKEVLRDAIGGGVGLPWNLGLCIALGILLLFTRPLLGSAGGLAEADHLVGSLVITIAVTALAEVARPLRFLIMPLGLALLVTPFVYQADWVQTAFSCAVGLALMLLSARRGRIRWRYGAWNRLLR